MAADWLKGVTGLYMDVSEEDFQRLMADCSVPDANGLAVAAFVSGAASTLFVFPKEVEKQVRLASARARHGCIWRCVRVCRARRRADTPRCRR
jgi:hypothetical protein